MASSERDDALICRSNCLWTENSRVYTRRKAKKAPSFSNIDDPSNPATASTAAGVYKNGPDAKNAPLGNDGVVQESVGREHRPPRDFTERNTDSSHQNCTVSVGEVGAENSQVESELCDIGEPKMHNLEEATGSVEVSFGALKPLVMSHMEDRVRFAYAKATPKNEIKSLSIKLESELEQIRNLMKRLESPEVHENQPTSCSLATYSNLSNGSNINGGEGGDNECAAAIETTPPGLSRVNGDSKGDKETRPHEMQLTVSVTEANLGSDEHTEKEKRTPKANHYYKSSDFLLGKDKLPPEGAKRQKTSNGKKKDEQSSAGFGLVSEKQRNWLHKNCSNLLQRLMKHKHGWVFNEPVNVEALGCVDYYDTIKHPMDLGTIKTRLSQRSYENPSQFAEDVRLVFLNAMTYNPKGHDVHVMAEELSKIFEERWAVIESELNSRSELETHHDDQLPAPPRSRRDHSRNLRALDITPKKSRLVAAEAKVQAMPVVRTQTPVGKKPKAKDANKRNMTYEEKQKLSANLEKLPSEKLDAIIQIIKKRNTALSQNDDEIEVDIDSVDAETLWELDRFVSNYKKNLSKKRRRAEIALGARSVANVAPVDTSKEAAASRNDRGAASYKSGGSGENVGRNGNKSSSSGSSSGGESGSSSSGK